MLVLERDEAHQGRVLEDVTVLFLTPRHGNVAWSDREGRPAAARVTVRVARAPDGRHVIPLVAQPWTAS